MKIKNNFVYLMFFIFFLVLTSFVIAESSEYGPVVTTNDYSVSRSLVDRNLELGQILSDSVEITNNKISSLEVSFSASPTLSEFIEFEANGLIIGPENTSSMNFLIKGKQVGSYSGDIILAKGIDLKIPVNLTITEQNLNPPVLINVNFEKNNFLLNKPIKFQIDINKLKPYPIPNATFRYTLRDFEGNVSYFLGSETIPIDHSFEMLKNYKLPAELIAGEYYLEVNLTYENKTALSNARFLAKKAFYNILVFGFIPLWAIIFIFSLIALLGLTYYFIRRNIEGKKKYKMKLDLSTLPKKSGDFLCLGKIAEKNIEAYLDPNRLTTHSIVAGATGGGKSITAQVIIEEALLHNISVIVFDPTAQWSGMLRKCDDKKMMAHYRDFGLKESDARGFKGNVRQVLNARQLIDINKYIHPGQIQIFSLNKLDPKEMDIFVANVIRQIFKSDPKESPVLKTLIVFDEVHRLLSKFGGSGEGFLQVERACREFRKWGLGVMLVSQVLSDFVGEIKANISTEVQMRTRDEGDLNRIKTKNGEEFLQSLVKASVGVGMFVNPAYNHAKPYFIQFRPILHNTRRLSDEELEKYNKYNDLADDLEYSIEQLEKEKIDVFDLKMELKLVRDKIMTGSFSVVEIYLEGLMPRVNKEWEKLGKKAPKRQLELVSEDEIKKSIDEAKKARAKVEEAEAKKAAKEALENKQEAPKENLETRDVAPLIFDNGVSVSSVKELKGVLETMESDIFKTHVNESKNDISKWIGDKISKNAGENIKNILTKPEMIKALADFKLLSTIVIQEEKKEEKKVNKQ